VANAAVQCVACRGAATPGRAIGHALDLENGDRRVGHRDQAGARVQSVARGAKFRLASFVPTEYELQRSVADMLDWLLVPPAFYTAFPAGWGKLPPATAGLLKACGLKRGFPDILIIDHDGKVPYPRVIGIELKRNDNKSTTSDEQDAMHQKLINAFCRVYVARTIEEVLDILDREQVHRRAHFLDQERKRGTA
jgi:hypothetical protein